MMNAEFVETVSVFALKNCNIPKILLYDYTHAVNYKIFNFLK
jgi:hypothetical protein